MVKIETTHQASIRFHLNYDELVVGEVLGLPTGTSVDISPNFDRSKYKVFVQSTSVNRKLKAGTTFLYEAS